MHKEQRAKAWDLTVKKSQAAKKRVGGLFSSMSVAHAEDEEEDENRPSSGAAAASGDEEGGSSSDVIHVERLLSNGDFYTGQWSDNFPHGVGKYLWTDGCMYEGEWCRGKTMGRGKFSWPSGATYEGEFKTGFMDGFGTYTSSDGDTYRGHWVMNLKNGKGQKSYGNGDFYDGDWSRGSQDGHGKYLWRNGNHYEGSWKAGQICGKGTMVWANGNRYTGYWEDGLPKGEGKFLWANGSFYAGTWSKDPQEQSGTYYPSGGASPMGSMEWDPQDVFSIDLNDCKICPGETVSILPSQKALNWTGLVETDYPQQQQKQVSWSNSNAKDGSHNSNHQRPRWRKSIDAARRSSTERALEGITNWDDIGFDCLPQQERKSAFDALERRSIVGDDALGLAAMRLSDVDSSRAPRTPITKWQPREMKRQGETISKGHKNYDLMLNLQLGIRHSVGKPAPATSLDLKASAFDPKEKVWTKFPPEGTKHTPPHQSCEFRWKDYCPLVFRSADYMLSICGNDALRELSSPGKSGSFFYLTNDDRYMIKTMKKSEVKGLPHGRTTDKPEAEIDYTTTLKDLDLNFIFRLQKAWFQEFHRQVDRDCDLLEQERIMDYSLLVGLHFREATFSKDQNNGEGNGEADQPIDSAPRLSRVDMDQLLLDPFSNILQDYDISKKLEHAYKSIQYDPTSISAVDPKQYSKRFRDFIFKVFTEDV
ncbi:hypothetical protein ACLOJK_024700 [Asimina triloba]